MGLVACRITLGLFAFMLRLLSPPSALNIQVQFSATECGAGDASSV